MAHKDRVVNLIGSYNPHEIFITAPSCTGKTTLSKYLASKYGYIHIELDVEIINLGADVSQTYKSKTLTESQRKLKKIIDSYRTEYNKIIFDGSLSSLNFLKELFVGNSTTILLFLYPVNYKRYLKRVYSRFKAEWFSGNHTLALWNDIDYSDLKDKRLIKLNLKKMVLTRMVDSQIRWEKMRGINNVFKVIV